MNLFMAIRVYKNAVLCLVAATVCFVGYVVVVPTGILRDWLIAERADAFLFLPELQ